MSEHLKGLREVIENIQEAVDKMESGSVKGLANALLFVGTESQQKAPVEFGDLRGSLEVDIDNTVIAKGKKGGGITVCAETPEKGIVGKVSYNETYAAVQHERVDFKHPLGGQAKYLETVLNNEKSTILHLIGDGVKNELAEE